MTVKTYSYSPSSIIDELFQSVTSPSFFKMLDEVADVSKAYNTTTSYPYNLKTVYKDDVVVKDVIEFALAGFEKSDISVRVVDDKLYINTRKTLKDQPDNEVIKHHGIAERELNIYFRLGSKQDKTNIKSSMKNGLLIIEIPYKADEQHLIEITD